MQLRAARRLRRGPGTAARAVGAHRDRRRVPALGHVRPDGGDVRRAVLPAAAVDPAAGQGVRGPWRRAAGYAAILVAEEILDIFQRDLMKDERVQPLTRATQPDPRGRGGPAHALRPRGDRPADAGADALAAAPAPHGVAVGGRDRRRQPGPAGGLRLRRARPGGGQGGRPGQPPLRATSSATPPPVWSPSSARSA